MPRSSAGATKRTAAETTSMTSASSSQALIGASVAARAGKAERRTRREATTPANADAATRRGGRGNSSGFHHRHARGEAGVDEEDDEESGGGDHPRDDPPLQGDSQHLNDSDFDDGEDESATADLSPAAKKRRLEKDLERGESTQRSLEADPTMTALRAETERLEHMQALVSSLTLKRNASLHKAIEVLHSDEVLSSVEVLRINVGGELFAVPFATLLQREPTSMFSSILHAAGKLPRADDGAASDTSPSAATASFTPSHGAGSERGCSEPLSIDDDAGPELFVDDTGAVFIDRDPDVFRLILLYLRGYSYLHTLEEEQIKKLRVDARYYNLQNLLRALDEPELLSQLAFREGPGVSPDRSRLRVVYGVAAVGDTFLVTGRHRITFQILSAEYVGVGLISDSCISSDQECHKTLNCCIYYMSGVFYTNYPHHRKEENLERFETDDYVSVLLDMDLGYAEFAVKNSTKLISLGGSRRLKFSATMKLASRVRIVPPEEAAALPMVQRLTDSATGTPLFASPQLNQPHPRRLPLF